MFGKLLKAEWRSSRRTVGILCAVILIAGLLVGLMGAWMMRLSVSNTTAPDFLQIIFVLLMMAAVVAVPMACVASVFYALYRFYRSRFTEEGYLTYTLPVNNHQLMLSSILASVLEILLVLLAAALAVALCGGLTLSALPWEEVSEDFFATVSRYAGAMGQAILENLPDILRGLGMLLLMALSQLIMLMLAVTIGSIAAKKHPVLMAFVVYYGIDILRLIVGILVINGSGRITGGLAMDGTLDVISVITILGGYFAMYYLTSRKLNLS
ncbi:MAG: hypothetical protein SOZ90_08425 [Candidatus Faecousia sp.]|nr:hypothetical protein [Candidatus Faecousia sp.]